MTKKQRQKLFEHMMNEHGITLLDSEMMEIEAIILPPKPYPYKLNNEPKLVFLTKTKKYDKARH
mgnify:CR=1 FL=1